MEMIWDYYWIQLLSFLSCIMLGRWFLSLLDLMRGLERWGEYRLSDSWKGYLWSSSRAIKRDRIVLIGSDILLVRNPIRKNKGWLKN